MRKHKRYVRRNQVMCALRCLINAQMNAHNFKYELMKDCELEDGNPDAVGEFMVSFYDKDHKLLVRNWLMNGNDHSFSCTSDGSNEYFVSPEIEFLSTYYSIDIQHLMWQGQEKLLDKVRFIQCGLRNEFPALGLIIEEGVEVEPFNVKDGNLAYHKYIQRFFFFDDSTSDQF